MAKYGMVIDLSTCIRDRACMIGCKFINRIPSKYEAVSGGVELYRLRPVDWEEGKYPDVKWLSIPVSCQHCDTPTCMAACAEGAITKRDDGIVVIDKEKCIGCSSYSCVSACPYLAIYIWDGKADMCDFCLGNGKLERDGITYCAEICPCYKTKLFGDLNDPTSEVAKLVASGAARQLCPQFGTGPNVYYVPPFNYKAEWDQLSQNQLFLKALELRKKDLVVA